MAVPPKMEPSDVSRAFMEPAPEGNKRRTGSDEFAGEVEEGGREPSGSPPSTILHLSSQDFQAS
ncbi:unnamed protein product, partial [Musa textilis]